MVLGICNRCRRRRLRLACCLERPVVWKLKWSEVCAQDKQPKTEAVQSGAAKEDPPNRGLDAIPGAILFIQKIKSLDIQPVSITNRNERAHARTLKDADELLPKL